ncbi:MAG: Hsp20/alpha crystallin family protein [Bdellovibrionales bacterium]|nr:Hsp20/alpha crystallin family protein [Bdellovibrionales bacterium]
MRTTMLTPYWKNADLTSVLWNEMDRFFTDFGMSPFTSVYDERAFSPRYDINETADHILFSVDLPGMKKEDIKIEAVNNMLTVSGEHKKYGFFKRSFPLSASLEIDKAEARYENGVLELYLPKAESAKPRQIAIQTGQGGFIEKLLSSRKNNQELKDVKVS